MLEWLQVGPELIEDGVLEALWVFTEEGQPAATLLILKGREHDVDPIARNVGGGADGHVVGATCITIVVPGARLTPDRSLAREYVPLACPEAPSGREALPAVRLQLFRLHLLQREGRRWRYGCPSSG